MPFFDKNTQLGYSKKLEDTLSIMKSYFGSQIKRISK
jgi:hypothetical protein